MVLETFGGNKGASSKHFKCNCPPSNTYANKMATTAPTMPITPSSAKRAAGPAALLAGEVVLHREKSSA